MTMGSKFFAERSGMVLKESAVQRVRAALSLSQSCSAKVCMIAAMAASGIGLAVIASAPAAAQVAQVAQAAQIAQVQERGDWYISVGGVIVAEPGRESAFPIVVGPASALPIGSSVRIIGLSPYCELLGGTLLAQGAWSVPAEDLGRLRIRVPQVEPIRMEIRLALVDSGGAELARARSTFMIAKADELAPADQGAGGPARSVGGRDGNDASDAPSATPRVVQPPTFAPAPRGDRSDTSSIEPGPPGQPSSGSAAATDPAQPPVVRALSGEALQAALAQMERGNGLVARGDYATARLFFRKAAELGHAPGAIALAKTFDPAELRRLGVVGFTGDQAKANKWYARAKELGAASF